MRTLRGIDISSWQGDVDFPKVKDSGVEFCILRAGCGLSRDSKFTTYVAGAQKAGIPILGVYHFVYVKDGGMTATQNAMKCIENVKSAGLDPMKIWIWCDLEYDTWAKLGRLATKSECTRYVKEFMDTMRGKGLTRIGVYTNGDYFTHYLDWSILKDYRDHLWLADLNGRPDYQCSVHQYSFTGRVDGISGNVDLDYLLNEEMLEKEEDMSEKEVIALIQKHAPGVVRAIMAEEHEARQKASIPAWLVESGEYDTAIKRGITDGSRPSDYATRYEATLMADRAAEAAINRLTAARGES